MDSQNTIVYIRVKGKRPANFTDPPAFDWDLDKEKRLWNFLSKLHDPDEEIDWDILSEGLNTPIYFLKRRCYELFTKHLELLKQQIDKKNRNIPDDEKSNHSRRIKKEVELLNQVPVRTPGTIQEETNDEIEADINELKGNMQNPTGEDITKRAINHLKSSKILNFNHEFYKNNKDINQTAKEEFSNNIDKDSSESELSSSLGVSKSTLEEALMDKLQI